MSNLPIYERAKQFMRKGYLHYPFGLFVVLLSWGVYFIYLWPKMLFWTRNGLTFGWIGIWCNWSAHFSYASALWKGYIDIDVQGTYTFKLTSDDGS